MREDTLSALLWQVRGCRACATHLPYGPRPVLQAGEHARLLIGRYAQEFYLRDRGKNTLTETVAAYEE